MTLKTLVMTAAVSALMAGGAIAQDADTNATDPAAPLEMIEPDAGLVAPEFSSISDMTVGDIVGQKVYEPTGDTIGKITHIISQYDNAAAVVGVGGFLGIGQHSVALPLSDFTYDAEQKMVKLDTTKEALESQPEFDTSDVESLPDETPLAGLLVSTDEAPAAPSTTLDDGATTDDGAAIDDGATTSESGSDDGALAPESETN